VFCRMSVVNRGGIQNTVRSKITALGQTSLCALQPWPLARIWVGTAMDGAKKIYDTDRESVGNFVDSVIVYTNGSIERLVDEFVGAHRLRYPMFGV
jgi:hypothetical protein